MHRSVSENDVLHGMQNRSSKKGSLREPECHKRPLSVQHSKTHRNSKRRKVQSQENKAESDLMIASPHDNKQQLAMNINIETSKHIEDAALVQSTSYSDNDTRKCKPKDVFSIFCVTTKTT